MVTTCGKFALGSRIEKGAQGEVVLAVDCRGLQVAAKLPRKNREDHTWKHVENEAVLLRSVAGHPGIMRCLALTRLPTTGKPVLVMPLFPLKDLYAVIEHDVIGEAVTADIVYQVADAAAHLHTQGVSHNDIKAENLMVASNTHSPFLDVVLCDFGHASRGGVGKTPCGTEESLSPEARHHMLRWRSLEARQLTPEAVPGLQYDAYAEDVWAIGAMAHICLTHIAPQFTLDPKRAPRDISVRLGRNTVQLSGGALDFLRFVLNPDATRRPKPADLLLHPWICEHVLPFRGSRGGITPVSPASPPSLPTIACFGGRSAETATSGVPMVQCETLDIGSPASLVSPKEEV